MRIQVLADGIELTDGIRAHAHKRLYYAIGWAGAQVELVQLRVLDLNGPKGGVDKCCRIRIELRRGGVVTIEETAELRLAHPHVVTLEEGSRYKRVDADQLGFKREVDPMGLLNPGKMKSFATA